MKNNVMYLVLGSLVVGLFWFATENFMPVGDINGKVIYRYELNSRARSMSGNIIKNIAKDKAYFKAMDELGITATDNEMQNELQGYYDRYGGEVELKNVLLDTQGDVESLKNIIKKGILSEKAINYFANKVNMSEKDLIEYYKQNKDKYGDDYDSKKEQIRGGFKLEQGNKLYEEYLDEYESKVCIKVY